MDTITRSSLSGIYDAIHLLDPAAVMIELVITDMEREARALADKPPQYARHFLDRMNRVYLPVLNQACTNIFQGRNALQEAERAAAAMMSAQRDEDAT